MKKLIMLLFMVTLLFATQSNADCPLNCMFSFGTTCVNNECVKVGSPTPTPYPVPTTTPIPTPTPVLNEIKLESKPIGSIVVTSFDCSIDLNTLRIFLVRSTPPKEMYFYSSIYYYDAVGTTYFFAKKDILNKYVFTVYETGDTIKSQFYGLDFVFNYWENKAFTDFFKSKNCSELRNLFFLYGTASNKDYSDFEGAIFIFN